MASEDNRRSVSLAIVSAVRQMSVSVCDGLDDGRGLGGAKGRSSIAQCVRRAPRVRNVLAL